MTYNYKDAVETLAVILKQYDKNLVAECAAAYMIRAMPSDGRQTFIEGFDGLNLTNNNGKYSVKFGNEE
jgi:hypothetical protein